MKAGGTCEAGTCCSLALSNLCGARHLWGPFEAWFRLPVASPQFRVYAILKWDQNPGVRVISFGGSSQQSGRPNANVGTVLNELTCCDSFQGSRCPNRICISSKPCVYSSVSRHIEFPKMAVFLLVPQETAAKTRPAILRNTELHAYVTFSSFRFPGPERQVAAVATGAMPQRHAEASK